MLSHDLFWGSRPVSAATSEPESKNAAPKRKIQISSKVLSPPFPLHRLSPPITYSWGNYTPAIMPLAFPTPLQPALLETGFFAFARARKCFDWLIGGKPSSDYASSSSSSQLLGFGFGPLHARRCKAPVIEDRRPFAPSSRPVFLVSTPVSSYSSGTSASSRGWGNSSVSVAFGVGA